LVVIMCSPNCTHCYYMHLSHTHNCTTMYNRAYITPSHRPDTVYCTPYSLDTVYCTPYSLDIVYCTPYSLDIVYCTPYSLDIVYCTPYSPYVGGEIVSGGGFSNVAPRPAYQQAAVAAYLNNSAALPPDRLYNSQVLFLSLAPPTLFLLCSSPLPLSPPSPPLLLSPSSSTPLLPPSQPPPSHPLLLHSSSTFTPPIPPC
jgi:hypothetical protein